MLADLLRQIVRSMVGGARSERGPDADQIYRWAVTRHSAGDLHDAAEGYARVLRIDPHHVLARGNLGSIRLGEGDFSREAWALYLANLERRREDGKQLGLPLWDGEDPREMTLLAFGHQGLGDHILFGSCLSGLKARKLIVCIEPRLVGMFARALPHARVEPMAWLESRGWEREALRIDACVPLARLAMEYRRRLSDFPRAAYLRPEASRVAGWEARLARLGTGPKVGLSWRGGSAKTRTDDRSIALADLAPLLRTSGVTWVSLQYGEVSAEVEQWRRDNGGALHHWQDAIDDYEETAALASALGRVVSVTTALVHLCGAIGVPAWVLVDYNAQWRYGNADTMPWYSSVQLFRQHTAGDWRDPVAAVAKRLGEV